MHIAKLDNTRKENKLSQNSTTNGASSYQADPS